MDPSKTFAEMKFVSRFVEKRKQQRCKRNAPAPQQKMGSKFERANAEVSIMPLYQTCVNLSISPLRCERISWAN